MRIVDLFAGPGGWDVAAAWMDEEPLGIEWDDAACKTREAAGLRTLQADIGAIDPRTVVEEAFGAPVDGLIASPPCQAFSMAGKGAGRRAISSYRHACSYMAHGHAIDHEALAKDCHDERAHLVLEPLRWAIDLRPRWIACEQVRPVLPVWEAMADALKVLGYHAWSGLVSAEQYGVPQTRERALLLARLDAPVHRPPPTHAKYVPPRKVERQDEGLFATEPERITRPEDRDLLPWVAMADALGWGMTARPYPVLAGGTSGGPDLEKVGGSSARQVIYDEQAAGRWEGQWLPYGQLTQGGRREDGEWRRVRFRATNDRPNGATRSADEPAPSLAFGHNAPTWEEDRPTHYDVGASESAGARPRPVDEPAPTITASIPQVPHTWTNNRSATTLAGDPRVFQPGGHHEPGQQSQNAVRVTAEQAAVLQSFPPDYPWQGTKTKMFEQIGNAVPPLLAWAALQEVSTPR